MRGRRRKKWRRRECVNDKKRVIWQKETLIVSARYSQSKGALTHIHTPTHCS